MQIMEGRVQRRRYVVLVPCPLQGHMTPMLQLGHILYSRGFSIIVAHTQYNAPEPSNHPEFSFHSLADGIHARDSVESRGMDAIYAMNKNCRVPLHDYLEEKGDEVGCIIYDNLMFFVDHVATHRNLPSIVLRPFNAVFLQVLLHILDNGDTVFALSESRLQDPIPEFYPLRYKDVPFSVISGEERRFLLTATDIRSSVAMIWNTVEDLEHTWLLRLQHLYKVPIFPIGPFHKMSSTCPTTSLIEEDDSCLTWLDKQAPQSVLYVSASGSLASIDEREFAEIAWGLAQSHQPFLWAVRPGSINGSEWTERLPVDLESRVRNRGRIVKWAPQKDVLAHSSVGGFWSHCGWNSTLEGLGEGIPMICRPYTADQLVNTRLVVREWKVGLELEEVERGAIAETVRKIMVGEEGRELKKNAMEMRRKMDDSLQKDGPSYRALNELTCFISSLHLPNSTCEQS